LQMRACRVLERPVESDPAWHA